jgi:hypothetical protein
MKRCLAILLAAMLLFALGCGSDKDRGVNSGRDRPKAAERGE